METYYRTGGDMKVKDESERLVELSFSSETPVVRFGGVYEVLSHKDGAADLQRLRNGGCLLFNHNPDKILGAVVEAEIRGNKGIALVRFDDDAESEVIFRKVKSGSLKGVSVGYRVLEKTKASGRPPVYTAAKWEPFEISIVSIPADISVGVGRSAANTENGTDSAERRIMLNRNKYLRLGTGSACCPPMQPR